MAAMLGKLACMRLRSWRCLKPGREKQVYTQAAKRAERRQVEREIRGQLTDRGGNDQ